MGNKDKGKKEERKKPKPKPKGEPGHRHESAAGLTNHIAGKSS